MLKLGPVVQILAVACLLFANPSYAQEAASPAPKAPEKAPQANEAEAVNDPRSSMPVFKIWQRHADHGGRFIQMGESGEVLPIEELPKIIALDRDEEIQKHLAKYRTWKTVSHVATGLAIASGLGAFTLGWMSVSNHESGTGSVLAVFAASLAAIAGRTYAENLADQALYRAQATHNNRILERKPPKTGSLSPHTLAPLATVSFDFPLLGGGR